MPRIQRPTDTPTSGVGMIEDKPDNAIVVTYSELDTFRQCPLKHDWSYRKKWRREPEEGSPLKKGSLWHSVMESHYLLVQRGETDLDHLRQFMLQHLLTDQYGQQSPDQELIEWMYDGYLECYGVDSDWEPVLIEQAGEVPLRDAIGRRGRYFLRFKIDLVWRERSTGRLWLVDHKTASSFSRETEIELDDQFRLYTWALRESGVPIFGIIRSDARTKRNKTPMTLDQRFRRTQTFCTEEEGRRVAEDAMRAARAAYSAHLPVYASAAPDRCTWRCDFLQAHLAYRRGISDEETILRDFGFKQVPSKHREYLPDPVAEAIRQGKIS